jgi:hypothetical protein
MEICFLPAVMIASAAAYPQASRRIFCEKFPESFHSYCNFTLFCVTLWLSFKGGILCSSQKVN